MIKPTEVWAALDRHLPSAYELRREIHRYPDLSGDELQTKNRVLAALPSSGRVTPIADTGAVVRFGTSGPGIGLRGEMDALPISEATFVDWQSVRSEVMHACGHDVHLAALVAVVRALDETGYSMPLIVVLQPREETYPSGAKEIAENGVLDDEQYVAMIGVHVQPVLDADVIACTPGGVNASSDEFTITVEGTPGHAAYPHLTHDPLLALAEIVVSLQSIVSRSIDPMAPAVVGVCSFNAGNVANVIPGVATATGTLRALSVKTRELAQSRIEDISKNIAQAHDCSTKVIFTRGEPVLYNNPELTSAISARLIDRGVEVSTTLRSLGSDDFSYYSEQVPATMLFVGCDSTEQLHSPTFLPSDTDVRRVAHAFLSGYLGAVDFYRTQTLVLGDTQEPKHLAERRPLPTGHH